MSGQNGMSRVSPAGSAGSAGNAKQPNGNGKANNGTDKPRLTESEKKQNHIESEQKRRKAIRHGFERLVTMLPGFEGDGRSEAKVLQATVHELTRQMQLKKRIYAKVSKMENFTEADFQRFYNTGQLATASRAALEASKSASPAASRGGRRRSTTSATPGPGRGRRRSSATVGPAAGGRRRSSKTATPVTPVIGAPAPTPATPNGARIPSAYAEQMGALRLGNTRAVELAHLEEVRRHSVAAGSTASSGFTYSTPGAINVPVTLPYAQPRNIGNAFNSPVVPAYPTVGYGVAQGGVSNQVIKRESPQSSPDAQAGQRGN